MRTRCESQATSRKLTQSERVTDALFSSVVDLLLAIKQHLLTEQLSGMVCVSVKG
jgi:hypothetical protein